MSAPDRCAKCGRGAGSPAHRGSDCVGTDAHPFAPAPAPSGAAVITDAAARLDAMLEDDGEHWDLSEKDKHAIRVVKDEGGRARDAEKRRTETLLEIARHPHAEACTSAPGSRACDCFKGVASAALADAAVDELNLCMMDRKKERDENKRLRVAVAHAATLEALIREALSVAAEAAPRETDFDLLLRVVGVLKKSRAEVKG